MSLNLVANNRGMALLVTITIVALLVATAVELNRKARSTVISMAATRDHTTLLQTASGCVNAAMALLVRDRIDSDIDSVQEDWANPETISELIQDISFQDGKVTLKISDELGKIQVNALVSLPQGHNFNDSQAILWDRFLRYLISDNDSFEHEEIEPTEIINSLKDWIDSEDDDAITGLSGAESDYYEGLDPPPYACRNGRFTLLDELVMVKGITPEFFYGTGEFQGIARHVTIFGMNYAGNNLFTYQGKVNISTAEVPLLAALLPQENKDLAEAIYDYRIETSDSNYVNDLSSQQWYKNVPGCSEIKIDPDLITTASDFFKIESTAAVNGMELSVNAVVHREKEKKTGKWKCKIISWQAE